MVTIYYKVQDSNNLDICESDLQKRMAQYLKVYPYEVFRKLELILPKEEGMELEEIFHFLQELLEPYMPQVQRISMRFEDYFLGKQTVIENHPTYKADDFLYTNRLVEEFSDYLSLEYGVFVEYGEIADSTLLLDFVHSAWCKAEYETIPEVVKKPKRIKKRWKRLWKGHKS